MIYLEGSFMVPIIRLHAAVWKLRFSTLLYMLFKQPMTAGCKLCCLPTGRAMVPRGKVRERKRASTKSQPASARVTLFLSWSIKKFDRNRGFCFRSHSYRMEKNARIATIYCASLSGPLLLQELNLRYIYAWSTSPRQIKRLRSLCKIMG